MADILVVDDDILCGAMLSLDLLRLGHRPCVVASAQAALKRLAAKEPVDLVVTDLLMPDMDGIELIQAIRRDAPALPVIAVSCGGEHPNPYLFTTAQVLGADRVLAKPVDAATIGAAIDQLLAAKAHDDNDPRPRLASVTR